MLYRLKSINLLNIGLSKKAANIVYPPHDWTDSKCLVFTALKSPFDFAQGEGDTKDNLNSKQTY